MFDLTKVEIYTLRTVDLDEIKANLQKDFDDFWNYEIFKQEIVNTNSSYLALRYYNEIVCLGGFKKILDTAEIMNIVTKKSKRNMGFAKLLLNELINIASKENIKFINLEVNENNLPAIKLYKNFGFEQVGLRKKYYQGKDNAILMTLNII